MIKNILLCLCVACFLGCTGHCIKFEGTYDKFSGGLTWCKDVPLTNANGRETLENKESGEKALLIKEKEIEKITKVLEENSTTEAKIKALRATNKFRRLIEFLENLR